jgi:superfamily I DNA/RNA helicase
VARLGRKTRLGEKQRKVVWDIIDRVRTTLDDQGLTTLSGVFARVTENLTATNTRPFDYAVIDEAQDISVPQLRLMAALGSGRPNSLFFAGDLGQRIFQYPFSWLGLGVDIRGRSHTLRINYRTSHQIRRQADRLLPPAVSDIDGNTSDRRGTVSVFNGPDPMIEVAGDEQQEIERVAQWLAERASAGIQPHEIAVFVRSAAQLDRAGRAVETAGLAAVALDENVETKTRHVSISTMHLAKGLEFRAVAVMACDDEVIPLQERIAAVGDDADLEDVYSTERHLLYVAVTRVRDHLLVTGVEPASEFLDDLRMDQGP